MSEHLLPLADDLRGPRQRVTSVARAEVLRLLRQGGLVGALIAGGAVGALSGLVALPLVGAATARAVCATTTAVVLAVALTVHTASHTTRGSGPTTLALVPDRRLLARARSLATALLAALHTGTVTLLVGLVAAGVDPGRGTYALTLGTAVAAATAAGCLATVAVAVGTLTDHPVGAVLTLGAWWAVVPLTCVAVARVPGLLGRSAEALLQSTPPVLVRGATDPVGADGLALLPWLGSQVGLAAWAGVAVAVSSAVLRRRSVTRDRTYPSVWSG